MIKKLLALLLLCSPAAFGLEAKSMLLWSPAAPVSIWFGQTDASSWKWGVLPMSESVADELAKLDSKKTYRCMVKSAETVGYTASYVTGIYELKDCKAVK